MAPRHAALITAISLLLLPALVSAAEPRREMNVWQGPETVFDQPVSSIIPALEGATPTKQNGRVGNEFVFWGYKLADGARANFYACAAVAGVDCMARREKICTKSMTVLSENMSMGQVQKLNCRVLCLADSPAAIPCCSSAQENSDLQVGLVSCGD